MGKEFKADNGIICYPGVVYRTKDYYIFKELRGNREVSEARKNTLRKSIGENGYIGAPIIVNEKFEVIDGQGRLMACKSLGVSIPFMVVQDLTVNECKVLNQNAKIWTADDYVKSYADQGHVSYKYLLTLQKEFGVVMRVATFAAKGSQASKRQIIEGLLSISAGEYLEARKKLKFIDSVKPYLVRAKTTRYVTQGLLFALSCKSVDWGRLRNKIEKYYRLFGGEITIEMAVESVENVYNFRTRKDFCVDLTGEYKRRILERKIYGGRNREAIRKERTAYLDEIRKGSDENVAN